MSIDNLHMLRLSLDNLNDGQWHDISLLLTQYRFNITVDYEPEFSLTRNNLSTTDRFTFSSNGDQINRDTAMNGFVGCVRQLIMSGTQILPRDLMSNAPTVRSSGDQPRTGNVINHGVLVDACEMFDRCTPNPCRHGGQCFQVRNATMEQHDSNSMNMFVFRHGRDSVVIVRIQVIVVLYVTSVIIHYHVSILN
jgi:hypothetical protein